MFAVYASTVTKMHEPVFTEIDLELDIDGRKGRIFVKDYIEMDGEPIRNKVTGDDSRAQIVLPDGFEYAVAEIGSASSRTSGPVLVDTQGQVRPVRATAPQQSRCRARLTRAAWPTRRPSSAC